MLMLVLGSNVLVMFVGWEGVGLCSYLLIGYYYEKQSASDAAKKAFIVNRVGDFAFILGALLLVGAPSNSLDFVTIALAVKEMPPEVDLRHAVADHAAAVHRRDRQVGADSAVRVAAGRDGRPDAGVGPHPCRDHGHRGRLHDRPQRDAVRACADHADDRRGRSARRRRSLPARSAWSRTTSSACSRIRRCRSWATCSWRWASARYGAGIFHLYTHAFFKACLFLGSGAVIHALHGEQDIRKMGGLKKHIPITYWTFVIASVAIAGVPLLSGFFSKDEILFETFVEGHQVLWGWAS